MYSGETQLSVEAAHLYIQAITVETHPALVCDLCNLRQVVIFELVQADVMGQPGRKGEIRERRGRKRGRRRKKKKNQC